jgi:hypothetical protein
LQKKSKLETKNKGVAEADKTEDVAEMKRITDGMDAEAKNFEGLKGKNKLFAKVKAGSGLGRNKRTLSVANVVPSSVASRGTSARALARATIYGDFLMHGNFLPVWNMAKAGLLKGYFV